jgi:CubicO group peptidase (beta-lactamase class C family)
MRSSVPWGDRLRELAEQGRVTGAVLGIWADGEEIAASFGVLSTATRVPVTTDSLFQLGSITKVWTATMIMQLIEEGRLSINAPIAHVLPSVRLTVGDVGAEVTIRHLLSHTSGIDGDILVDTGRGDDCVERYVAELAKAASVFPAGTAFSYCNSGFILLGRIIETLDGRSWDESLREQLTGPLGLTETVTLPEEAILHRAAVGHHEDGDPVPFWSLPRSTGPASGVVASARDLLRFARLHLDDGRTPSGKRLLDPDSARAMRLPHAAVPDFADPGAAMGLGWLLGRWGDRTIVGHDGGTVGQSAYLRIDPEARLAACLLTNSMQARSLFDTLFADVFRHYAGTTMPASPRPVDGPPPPDLERHSGRYERPARRFDVSFRDERLHVTITPTDRLAALTDQAPEEFVLYQADPSGVNFLYRSGHDEPWTPVSFGQLGNGTPYLFLGRRVAPRTA